MTEGRLKSIIDMEERPATTLADAKKREWVRAAPGMRFRSDEAVDSDTCLAMYSNVYVYRSALYNGFEVYIGREDVAILPEMPSQAVMHALLIAFKTGLRVAAATITGAVEDAISEEIV